jgi:hypothetical protein
MSNLQAKLASAFLLSVAASVGPMAGSGSARAADSCITDPKTETPQGKHWYYRLERGTGRHCWYLRGEDEASARTPTAEPVAAAKPAPPTTTGNAPTRSLADARAEFAPKARVEDNSAPSPRSVWPDPATAAPAATAPAPATTGIGPGAAAPATPPDSQLTSRWPQASAPSTANTAPETSLMVANAQADQAAATTPAPAEPAQAAPQPAREVGSLQKLALVVLGALALAGISGSLVYRLAGARSHRRRLERWPQRQPASSSLADEARGAPWVAPELSSTVPHADVAEADMADADTVPHVDLAHMDMAADRTESRNNDDSFEQIEDFLARLTRQLQDELQASRPAELENPRPH